MSLPGCSAYFNADVGGFDVRQVSRPENKVADVLDWCA